MIQAFCICLIILVLLKKRGSAKSYEFTVGPIFKGLAGLLWLWVLVTSLLYLITPALQHETEVTILSIASAWIHGQDIYTLPDAAERYSLLYGPGNYVLLGFFIKFFHNPLFITKLPGYLMFLASLGLFYFSLRTLRLNRSLLFVAMTTNLALLTRFHHFSYSARPDCYMLFCTSFALWVSVSQIKPVWKYLLLGICAGLATTFKIHGFFYVAPLVLSVFLVSPSYLYALAAVGVGLFTAYAPFLFNGVSLANYILWLKAASRHGFYLPSFTNNLAFLTPFLALMAAFSHKNKRHKIELFGFLLCTGIITLFASKFGAGANHYIPLIPLLVFQIFKLAQQQELRPQVLRFVDLKLLIMVLSFYALYQSLSHQKSLRKFYFHIPSHWAEYKELKSLVQPLDGKTHLVFNDEAGKYKSFYAPYVVNKTGYLFMDAAAMTDQMFAGLPIQESTYKILEACQLKYIIVAKTGKPFGYLSTYTGEPMYSQRFIDTFKAKFHEVHSLENYTLYACK